MPPRDEEIVKRRPKNEGKKDTLSTTDLHVDTEFQSFRPSE
jgi:hypothetical protein